MTLRYGQWIVLDGDRMIATDCGQSEPIPIDVHANADVPCVIKCGSGERYIRRLADVQSAVKFIENGNDYVREVFVAKQ